MATIKDIAKKAGVSGATVSYALNDSAQISKETKQKILKIAEEMNYKPNSIAKSLRTNKTKTIGVIVEDIAEFTTPRIIDGINQFAEKRGYHILLKNLRLNKRVDFDFSSILQYKDKINEHIEILLSKQIEGIIYIGFYMRDISNIIKKSKKPIIYTYCYNTNENSEYSVNYDDQLAAYQATEYLINKGHKKVGVINGIANTIPTKQRFIGYKKALVKNNLNFKSSYVKQGDWSYDSGYSKMKEFITESELTTAILAMNDNMAIGAIDAAKDNGISVPQELSIMGFDNKEFTAYCEPRITTMNLPLNEMGKESMKILIDLINDDIKNKSLKLKCDLIERDSVAKFE